MGIDIILNGFSNAPLAAVNEVEPNEEEEGSKNQSGHRIRCQRRLHRSVFAARQLRFESVGSSGRPLPLHITTAGTYFISLDPTSGAGDLDLYLFTSNASKKNTSLDDPNLIDFSAGASSNEVIAIGLSPGTYYIFGASAFEGSGRIISRD